jgi:hypothetical protein
VTKFVLDQPQLHYTILKMTSRKNKKVSIESRVFNREWSYKYFLSFDAFCGIVDKTVSIIEYIESNGRAIGE